MNPTMTTPTIQRRLADYLVGQAEWRESKSEEYPDDKRNADSAAALRRLAAYVAGLPASHSTLRGIDRIQRAYDCDVFLPGERGGELISRYGFDGPTGDQETLLIELAGAMLTDDREMREDVFPEGRMIFYEGDDPAKFIEEIGEEFPEVSVSVSLNCPAEHLDEICGSGRWLMGS